MKYHIDAFWKDQLNGAATRLPYREIEAEDKNHAVIQYLEKHFPYLGVSDYNLVFDKMKEL